jgi:hypothetical protein
MPVRTRRFVLLDNGGKTADRYTLFDTKPMDNVIHYIGFDNNPYHPQGFGQHGELSPSQFRLHKNERFRALGKVVKLETLPPQAQKFAKSFMDDMLQATAA